MIQLITREEFLRLQQQFHRNVHKQPITCTLIIEDTTSVGAFSDFTGDNPRTSTEVQFYCLYSRNFSTNYRVKYGLKENISGIVWVSPQDIAQAFGDYHLDKKKVKVELQNFLYIVDTIVYQSEMYDSCAAIEIRLTDPYESS